MKRPDLRKNLRRGIYVVPTSFTILNLFFGFRSILYSIRGMMATGPAPDQAPHFFEVACWSLFIAALFDTFDGLVARGLGATSEFGKEYDSLADVVTFGTAPAVLVYAWGLHSLDKLGAGISFLFLVAVSLRLARFNVMSGKTDYRYFVGLPSPAGALTLAAIINYAPTPIRDTDRGFAMVILAVTIAVAFAMVSPIRWRSQKGLNLSKGRSLMTYLAFALALAVFYYSPRDFLFYGAILYFVSGPLMRLWTIAFPSRNVPAEPARDVAH